MASLTDMTFTRDWPGGSRQLLVVAASKDCHMLVADLLKWYHKCVTYLLTVSQLLSQKVTTILPVFVRAVRSSNKIIAMKPLGAADRSSRHAAGSEYEGRCLLKSKILLRELFKNKVGHRKQGTFIFVKL